MHSNKLDFEKLNNVRDLGGIKTEAGLEIKKGKLIRSGNLYDASEEDKHRLSELVGLLVDFRSDMEKNEKPDPEIQGADYIHMPIIDELTAGITREENADKALMKLVFEPDKARQYMIATYQGFITGEMAIKQYRKFLELLCVEHKKAVLWHCTAGKDRAGFGTIILLKALGVSDSDIMDDYLYTNECLAKDIEFLSDMIVKKVGSDSPDMREAIRLLFGARKEYVQGLVEKANECYGGFDAFLENIIGLDDAMKDELRKIYLE